MIHYHKIISTVLFLACSVVFYNLTKRLFSSRDKCIEFSLLGLLIGNISGVAMSLLSNWIVHSSLTIGENFYGSMLITPPILMIYLRNEGNGDKIFSLFAIATSFFMIIGKLNCLLFHPDCWGVAIENNAFFDRHPIPLYEMSFQLLIGLFLVYLYTKKYKLVGVFWIGITALFELLIQHFSSRRAFFFELSFAQMIYWIILFIETPFLFLYAKSYLFKNKAIQNEP